MKKRLIWTAALIVVVMAMCFGYVADDFQQPGIHTLWRFLHMDTSGTCYLIEPENGTLLGESTYAISLDARDISSFSNFVGAVSVEAYGSESSGAAHLLVDGSWQITCGRYTVEFFADAGEHMVIWITEGEKAIAAVPGESYEDAVWALYAFQTRKGR